MKPLLKILCYLALTLLLGAFLTPWLWWGGHWLAGHGVYPKLGAFAFRRYFDRAMLVAALALLWPMGRWLAIPNVRGLGLLPNPRRLRDALCGFAASFLMMLALAGMLLLLRVVVLRPQLHGADFLSIAVSAAVVALLEEWLFRGGILGLLLRAMPAFLALFCVSALFAVVHFLKPPGEYAGPVHWLSGFELLPGSFAQFRDGWQVACMFPTLFLVGWILGWARLKTRALALPIGLHAGWILGFMGFSKVTRRVLKAQETLPWFGQDLKTGLGAILTVCLTGLLVWLLLRSRARKTGAS